ncbi:MAG: Mrp/NBP35 family ATP-binding protein [Lachnospiraceae bacterium]|nr:Mrp/NBP35 family ATP-binding protein [Lachnospiraceae bacterium]
MAEEYTNVQEEECTHDCSSCGASCSERAPRANLEEPMAGTVVKKMIGVVSGKGGVGKSMVTSLLSVAASREGKKVGILDADITGPSIPKIFGREVMATAKDENTLNPVITKTGLSMMSVNNLLPNSEDPVLWRGPILAGAVKQFWTGVDWGELDYLFVDMPPGTGDVPLTVFQSLPLTGIIIVTTPQDLVSMIVAKAVRMAEQMAVPILGIVENMSYMECPDCGKKLYPFGEGRAEELAKKYSISRVAHLPILPELASRSDAGDIENVPVDVTNAVKDLL